MGRAVAWLSNVLFILLASLAILLAIPWDFYNLWAGFLSICAIPAMVMLNIFIAPWIPGPRRQPHRGLFFLTLAVAAGAIIAPLVLLLFDGAITPPSIVATMYVIFSVVAMMWLSLIFAGWPVTQARFSASVVGLGVLLLAYGSAYMLFPFLFDFSSFGLRPAGLFPAWTAIVFCITTLAVIFALTLFGQMPLAFATERGQPVAGLVTGVFVLAAAAILMWLATTVAGLDPVAFMTFGPISFLFGVFMINDTTRGGLLAGTSQPVRGFCLLALSLAVGLGLAQAYIWIMETIAPGQLAGPPGYARELWLANAMLSITFPVILVHMHFLDGWPFSHRSGGERALEGRALV